MNAFGGALAWCVLFFVTFGDFRVRIIQRILLLGILVTVPLGLSLIESAPDVRSRLHKIAVKLQPFGATASVISLLLNQGPLAGALAAVWLLVNLVVAVVALSRIVHRRFWPLEEVSIDVGLLYLSVGGIWFLASRLGLQPLEFGDTIVLLTAVHFHFAGFAAPIIAGMAGRVVDSGWSRRLFVPACVAIITAMPIVAAGITLSTKLAVVGTLIISFGLLLLSLLVFRWLLRTTLPITTKLLLVVSGLSAFVTMPMACLYAYSLVAHELIFDIPTMAATHGVLNAVGFSLCGLAGWKLVQPPRRS
jgi:hypothetical protein